MAWQDKTPKVCSLSVMIGQAEIITERLSWERRQEL